MTASSPSSPVGLDEIRQILAHLPDPAVAETRAAAATLAGLGLDPTRGVSATALWLAGAQAQAAPSLRRPRIAVFAGSHGFLAAVPGRDSAADTGRALAALSGGDAPLVRACRSLDTDLQAHDLAVETPTHDFRHQAAMDEAGCAHAMAYGMMVCEPGLGVLVTAGLGSGGDVAAAALIAALDGGGDGVGSWLPEGAWGDDRPALVAAGDRAVARAARTGADPLMLVAELGGFEIAAIAGTVLAAQLARIPVVLADGPSLAAASALAALAPAAIRHCHAVPVGGWRGAVARLGIGVIPIDPGIEPALAPAAAVGVLRAAADLLSP